MMQFNPGDYVIRKKSDHGITVSYINDTNNYTNIIAKKGINISDKIPLIYLYKDIARSLDIKDILVLDFKNLTYNKKYVNKMLIVLLK